MVIRIGDWSAKSELVSVNSELTSSLDTLPMVVIAPHVTPEVAAVIGFNRLSAGLGIFRLAPGGLPVLPDPKGMRRFAIPDADFRE